MSTPDTAALAQIRAYHDLSKHRPERYAPGPGYLDWANQPEPFRRFSGCPVIALPLAAHRLTRRFAELAQPPTVVRQW